MANDLPETFGRVLRDFRKRKKWSQMKLAVEANMHLNALGNLERGKHNPSLRTVFVLCRTLGVSVAEVLKAVEETKPKV